MTVLTIDDVRAAIDDIRARQDDDDAAHSLDDALRARVLRAIADGQCQDPAGCARTALTTDDIGIARWCA